MCACSLSCVPIGACVRACRQCEDGDKVKSGDALEMHYTGTIDASSNAGEAGSKFDSSRDRDKTFDFVVGKGQVIKGWDEGLLGLCKGAKAILVIPPSMGYGERGAGNAIPGDATLNFDVEVVDVSVPKEGTPPGGSKMAGNLFKELDANKDKKLSQDEVQPKRLSDLSPACRAPAGHYCGPLCAHLCPSPSCAPRACVCTVGPRAL